jgi:signal transduction histidine kinase
LIWGYEVSPGIFLGAFLANSSVGAPGGVALGIAVGNTLEALGGAYGLKRWVHFDNRLERLRDVLGLIGIAAIASTALSATIGVGSAWLGGKITAEGVPTALWTWWLGDMMGDMVVAPFLLTLFAPPPLRLSPRRTIEFVLLLVFLLTVSQITLGSWLYDPSLQDSLIYLIFPLLAWAALRFGPRGAATAVLAVSALAVWSAVRREGPFVQATLNESLLSLQFFMWTAAGTTLVLAAVFQERKRAEEETQKFNLELQRVSRLKSEFASIVAHELKTPLTVITEGIGMVLDGVDGSVNERQQETLALAKDNVDRLGRLINNVLDYEKLESGRMELQLEWTDVTQLTREVFHFMEWIAAQKNIQLHLHLPPGPLRMSCDADKVKEVLINLLDNAMKHTPKGGNIWVRVTAQLDTVSLEVEDTGTGIRKEDQEKIFIIFRQANFAGKVKIPGFGIGLAVCKLLVDLQGGTISVESEPGHGTKFTIQLPRGQAPASSRH